MMDLNTLLATNRAPSAEELAELKKIHQGVLSESSHILDEINQLQKKIERRQFHNNSLLWHAATVRHVWSPLRNMPFDILQEIFSYLCLPKISGMMNASLVCKRWRQAALAAPHLWSTIRLNPERFPAHLRSTDALLLVAKKWIAYAGGSHLGLVLDGFDPSFDIGELVERVLTLERRSRWRSIMIEGNGGSGLLPFFFTVNDNPDFARPILGHSLSWDNLECLQLKINLQSEEVSSLKHANLHPAPLLKHLALPYTRLCRSIQAPWSQLIFLSLHLRSHPYPNQAWDEGTLDFSEYTVILATCESLEICHLHISPFKVCRFSPEPVVLKNVKKLRVNGFNNIPGQLFQKIITPRLLDFGFHSEFLEDELRLANYIASHGPTLQKFSFSTLESISALLEEILYPQSRGLTELTHFSISADDQDCLDFLDWLSSEPKALPNLEEFQVYGLDSDHIFTFVKAVESRISPNLEPPLENPSLRMIRGKTRPPDDRVTRFKCAVLFGHPNDPPPPEFERWLAGLNILNKNYIVKYEQCHSFPEFDDYHQGERCVDLLRNFSM